MVAPAQTLLDLLRKAADGRDLSLHENILVKHHYQSLRRDAHAVLSVLSDRELIRAAVQNSECEFRATGIQWTLRQFEAGKMDAEVAHREVVSIYRHQHDSRLRAPTLRADMAFYLALSTILMRCQRVTRNRVMDLCVALELLANMSRLEQVLAEHQRYLKARARRTLPVGTASHRASGEAA